MQTEISAVILAGIPMQDHHQLIARAAGPCGGCAAPVAAFLRKVRRHKGAAKGRSGAIALDKADAHASLPCN